LKTSLIKKSLTAGAKQELQNDMTNQTSEREASGRFAKGQSGNPSGRAKMPPEVRELLTAKAQDAAQVYIRYLSDGDPRVALKAAELLLDRTYGKPQQADEPISFELPEGLDDASALVELHASLLRATANGDVTVSDARDVSSLFETHRRLIETTELEQRICALEAQKEPSR
jgi:hypothetical protein